MEQTKASHGNTISGAELLVRVLEEHGIDTVFGYPGGAIMPVYDALVGSSLRHILTRHEQAAALAADGYARASGKVGVCIATSGPGATNLVTGIANAYMDSVPMLAITGQVASDLMGTDAFQEVDIFGMTMSVVKHSYIIRKATDIPKVVAEAYQLASSGRPGPVLIDFPKDVAADRVSVEPAEWLGKTPMGHPCLTAEQENVSELLARATLLIERASRPLLYVGGGVAIANAEAPLRQFIERTGIPQVCTLQGLGSTDATRPDYLGMLGMHGTKAANFAVQKTDLLICCGARFDDRATGKLDEFAPTAQVIHLDVDPAEVAKLRSVDLALIGPMGNLLDALRPETPNIGAWRADCEQLRSDHAWRYDAPGDAIYAPALLQQLSDIGDENLIITCDVGQHQMWVAQHCSFASSRNHLTSGGLGTMGFGVPAGIGACLARPNATVVAVSGDGSIMMNVQELVTLKRYGIPLRILLLDNCALGMVRQWQELFFDKNFSEVDLSDNPDFTQVAQAFGIEAFSISRRDQIKAAIYRLLHAPGPLLLHVRIDPRANVWPLVPPGKNNAQMMEGDAR